jgi:hypothetical protein
MEKCSSLRWNLWRRHCAASSIFDSWQILSTRWVQECYLDSCSGVWPNWTKTEPPQVLQRRIWHHHWTKLSNPYGKSWTNFAVQKIISKYMESIYLNLFGEYAERIYAYVEKTQRACPRGLSLKTISRYCPFKDIVQPKKRGVKRGTIPTVMTSHSIADVF